jgi:hypothetical protein
LSPGHASAEVADVTAPASAPELGAATVLDREGRAVPLESLWKDRPAVVAFVRHFG